MWSLEGLALVVAVLKITHLSRFSTSIRMRFSSFVVLCFPIFHIMRSHQLLPLHLSLFIACDAVVHAASIPSPRDLSPRASSPLDRNSRRDSPSTLDIPILPSYDWIIGHDWVPSVLVANSSRSPCPMLNTLANHGYLPRDGKNITKEM
jgi:hypothetical protein